MGEEHSFRVKLTRDLYLPLLPSSCVALGQLLRLSEPWLPHLTKWENELLLHGILRGCTEMGAELHAWLRLEPSEWGLLGSLLL